MGAFSHQRLNVLVVLGDTLDVSWVFPRGETDGVQAAAAQDQTCGGKKRWKKNKLLSFFNGLRFGKDSPPLRPQPSRPFLQGLRTRGIGRAGGGGLVASRSFPPHDVAGVLLLADLVGLFKETDSSKAQE